MVKVFETRKLREEVEQSIQQHKKDELVTSSSSDEDITFPYKEKDEFRTYFLEHCHNKTSVSIDKDTTLSITGTGNVVIKVSKGALLNLEYDNQKPSNLAIDIIVEKGVTLELMDIVNNTKVFKKITVCLEDNATLCLGQFIRASRFSTTTVVLNENTTYNLMSSYYAQKNKYYMHNTAIHKGKNSSSTMHMKGVALQGAQVICDGLVHMQQGSEQASGHQKIEGLLLDEESSISSEPVLEVEHNNVSCSHGASITQIKDEVAFYLKTRGLSETAIMNLIVDSLKEFSLQLFKQKDEIKIDF